MIKHSHSGIGDLNILPVNDFKKLFAVSIAYRDNFIAYKNAAALNAVDFIDGYDVGFMHADKMLFGQGIFHLFHVLQGDDTFGRSEYGDVIFQAFNK